MCQRCRLLTLQGDGTRMVPSRQPGVSDANTSDPPRPAGGSGRRGDGCSPLGRLGHCPGVGVCDRRLCQRPSTDLLRGQRSAGRRAHPRLPDVRRRRHAHPITGDISPDNSIPDISIDRSRTKLAILARGTGPGGVDTVSIGNIDGTGQHVVASSATFNGISLSPDGSTVAIADGDNVEIPTPLGRTSSPPQRALSAPSPGHPTVDASPSTSVRDGELPWCG